MTRLYLCEKPSQARDFARVLGATRKGDGCLIGNGTAVTWCIGHLLEMAPPEAYGEQYKRWDIDLLPILPKAWKVEATKTGRAQFKAVKACLAQASEVIIATDADREGETIAREVLELCRYRGPLQRLWLSALDDASIRKALAGLLPGEKTEALYQAGLGRARADWLVGMNLTRFYTCRARASGVSSVFSVGRVQTPTLRLIVDRDREIEGFRPSPYFELWVQLETPGGEFAARWLPAATVTDENGRCTNKPAAISVAQKVAGTEGRITKAETKRKREPAPLPYDLSTLQQEASRRFGLGAQEVLDIAQALYERHKATSYPRTDCAYLPISQWADAPKVRAMLTASDAEYGRLVREANSQHKSRAWNDAKITAHHAIIPNIPNGGRVDLAAMNDKERRVFDLVCRRYLAQFYPDFEYDQTVIEAAAAGETFQARGRIERVPGWRKVIQQELRGRDEGEEAEDPVQALPAVQTGEMATVIDTQLTDKQTKPPARYTEGTLIAAMKSIGKYVSDPRLKEVLRETAGIGTEATRAGIIETLLRRNFIERQKKYLVSTPSGRALIEALPEAEKDPAMTARWEQALDSIAQGQGSLAQFLTEQEEWVASMVQAGQVAPISVGQPAAQEEQPGKKRSGTVSRTVTMAGVGKHCPKCKEGSLVQRTAKAGNYAGRSFLGCSRFPGCHYSEWPR